MTIHVRNIEPEAYPPPARAAVGLPRRKWTGDESDRLSELGCFGGTDREREHFELIGGEIVPVAVLSHVHRDPQPVGFASIQEFPIGDTLVGLLVPQLCLELTSLGLLPMTDGEADE